MADNEKPDTEPVTHSLKGSVQIDLSKLNKEQEEVEDDG